MVTITLLLRTYLCTPSLIKPFWKIIVFIATNGSLSTCMKSCGMPIQINQTSFYVINPFYVNDLRANSLHKLDHFNHPHQEKLKWDRIIPLGPQCEWLTFWGEDLSFLFFKCGNGSTCIKSS